MLQGVEFFFEEFMQGLHYQQEQHRGERITLPNPPYNAKLLLLPYTICIPLIDMPFLITPDVFGCSPL
jgi:hypothetical protein